MWSRFFPPNKINLSRVLISNIFFFAFCFMRDAILNKLIHDKHCKCNNNLGVGFTQLIIAQCGLDLRKIAENGFCFSSYKKCKIGGHPVIFEVSNINIYIRSLFLLVIGYNPCSFLQLTSFESIFLRLSMWLVSCIMITDFTDHYVSSTFPPRPAHEKVMTLVG